MSVSERVKKLIIHQLGIDENNITEDAYFVDDLGADSIDAVELVIAFEVEFEIDIPEEDAEKLLRVGDLVKYVESRISKNET